MDPQPEQRQSPIVFWLLAAILIYAPLFRASNRPIPLLILELGALALLIALFWNPEPLNKIPKATKITLGALFALPLLYLIPIPAGLWAALPGHGDYAAMLGFLNGDAAASAWRGASLLPLSTEAAWLALMPPIAVFLGAVSLPTAQLKRLVGVLLGMAAFQAALGLIQYGDGPGSFFYFGNTRGGGSATGTYLNRDHLAGFLEMALPIALGLLAAHVGRRGRAAHYNRNLRGRIAFFSTLQGNQALIYAALAILILLGIVFTRSRAGIAIAMIGILLAAIAFAKRLGGNNAFGIVGTLSAVGISLGAIVGLGPVFQRFATDPTSDLRWPIFSDTLEGIGQFLPLGSGPGSYPEIFRRFQGADLSAFINRAHNDYLEWLFDGGVLAAAVLLVMLWFYLRQWPRVWQRGEWTAFRFAQVGAGIGILLMLGHTLIDFNLHKPANAVFMAFLAATFFHASEEQRPAADRSRRHQRTRRQPAPELSTKPVASAPSADQIANPFMD